MRQLLCGDPIERLSRGETRGCRWAQHDSDAELGRDDKKPRS